MTIQRTHTGILYPETLKENQTFMYIMTTFGFLLETNKTYDLAAFAELIIKSYDLGNPTVAYSVALLRNLA